MLGSFSLALGEMTEKQLEVLRSPKILIAQNQPPETKVATRERLVSYEYIVVYANLMAEFQRKLNEGALHGYELNFFHVDLGTGSGGGLANFIGIMKKPIYEKTKK